MKTIGLIGGTSWESTREYYQIINEAVRLRLGGSASASLILYSYNFATILDWQEKAAEHEISDSLCVNAAKLEQAGADFLLICANTLHRYYEQIQAKITIPILHIADVTAREIGKLDLKKLGLLGTPVTMEEDFYRIRLQDKFGLECLVPEAEERREIGRIIFQELAQGILKEESKRNLIKISAGLHDRGAQGIILGCTELPLLLKPADFRIPVFDTTLIHAAAAVQLALK